MSDNEKIARAVPVITLINDNLSIPDYQRPYTWKKKQVYQLLDDLKEAMDTNQQTYLVGTIIVFKTNEQKHEIVDGQQRLTSLSLILWLLNYKSLGLNHQKYSHSESQSNLIQNYSAVKEWIGKKELNEENFKTFILNNVWFVLIEAPSQDEAFVFFDSQNSRGMALKRYDLLKAHHLRYISDKDEKVAVSCTIFWEQIDKLKKLNFLIDKLLGRTRAWSRNEIQEVDVLNEFKSQRVSNNSDGFYNLNRYQQPPVFEKWRYIDREIHDDV